MDIKIPKVFIVKIPEKWIDGEWIEKYSPVKAERYGQAIKILGKGNRLLVDDIEAIEKGLEDFKVYDYLLLSGSPIQMGIAAHTAMKKTGGAVKFLTWDGRINDYKVQEVICG